MRKLLRACVLLAAFGIMTVATGCIFSPKEGGGGPPPPPAYEIPAYPNTVLSNLVKAYEARDSVEYKTIYDPGYSGTSTDLGDPNPATQVSTFKWADEVAALAHMARSTSISKVTLDLGGVWARQASDDPSHPEYAVIQVTTYRVEVIDATDYLVQSGPGDMISFTFKPTTPAHTSQTDTLWSIIKWTETNAP